MPAVVFDVGDAWIDDGVTEAAGVIEIGAGPPSIITIALPKVWDYSQKKYVPLAPMYLAQNFSTTLDMILRLNPWAVKHNWYIGAPVRVPMYARDAAAFGGLAGATSHASPNPAPLVPGLAPGGKRWSEPPGPWVNSPQIGWVNLARDVDGQMWLGTEQPGMPYGNWTHTQKSSSFLSDVAHSVGSVAKVALPVAATIASVVPGVGTGVAMALNTANQLAQGKSLKDAAIAAAKNSLPGGPLAAAAFDAAVNIAQGQNVGAAAIGAARQTAVAQGGPLAGAAFDAGLAASRGQNVIDATKGAAINAAIAQLPGGATGAAAGELVRRVVNGENVATAALAVGGQAAQRAAEGALNPMAISVRQYVPGAPQSLMANAKAVVAQATQSGLPSLMQGAAKQVAMTLLQSPHLQSVPAQKLADQFGVPLPVIREAVGAIVGSAQKASPGLAPSPEIAVTIGGGTSINDALAKVGNSAVAPPAASPAPGAPNPYTLAAASGKSGPVALPPKKMLVSIFRHVPRAHRVPLFRLWKHAHGMSQNAGRLPTAGEQSVPTGTQVYWRVKAGDNPSLIAKRVTGDERRYKELFTSNPDKKLNNGKTVAQMIADGMISVLATGSIKNAPPGVTNFASLVAGEQLKLPKSWDPFVIANPVTGAPMSEQDVTGGVALPPWTPKAATPPAPPPGIPPGLPPPASPPDGSYVMTLPVGALTAIKGQLGVWGQREKKITPAGYPSTFDLMPPIGETVDENFRSAVRSFQQWRGGLPRTDGTFDKPTHDALNAYTFKVATAPPDSKTPPELPPLPPIETPPGMPPIPGLPPSQKQPPPVTGKGKGGTPPVKGKGSGAGVAIGLAGLAATVIMSSGR